MDVISQIPMKLIIPLVNNVYIMGLS